jgi:hypothetical protein
MHSWEYTFVLRDHIDHMSDWCNLEDRVLDVLGVFQVSAKG